MKDLTKVIDTLYGIKRVMCCMKEHLHDGVMARTIDTNYIIGEYGITVECEVENKINPFYVSQTAFFINYDSDYIEVKEMIINAYNTMCDIMRTNIEGCENERV